MLTLNTIENINSALSAVRNNPDIRPATFYNRILLDTIKVNSANYVHLNYATKSLTLPKGHQKLNLRRLGSLTPHTQVLKEGIPPRPDLTTSESIELQATQFGRFMYFTDQIRTDVIDDIVAHYTLELSDLAVRTLEKFAREKLLSAPGALFANSKTSVGQLVPGDIITLADLRLQTAKFKRLLVNPIGGMYHYICSPEFIYDLLDDEYVQNYIEYGQNVKFYEDGTIPPLFNIRFIETLLDENLAPDLDHPGEYYSSGTAYLRLFGKKSDGTAVIFSVKDEGDGSVLENESDVTLGAGKLAARHVLTQYYYRDGSAIENRVYWKVAAAAGGSTGITITVNTNVFNVMKYDGTKYVTGDASDITNDVLASAMELPVNRGILTGADGLAKVMVEGQGGTEVITKPLGSAGTSDPLNQLSSVGFKIRGVGFGFIRPEAVIVTYSVPLHATETVGLTAQAMSLANKVLPGGQIYNNSGTDTYVNVAWQTGAKYVAGDKFSSNGSHYVAVVDHTASAQLATDIAAGKVVKLGEVIVNNPGDLGLKK